VAKIPPFDPSSLFPALYLKLPDIGVVSPLVHPDFLSTSEFAPAGADVIIGNCVGWLNLSDKSGLQTGLPNLPAVAMESNAEEWCSAVDIGGKEAF
jgi:hypothetical protein